jgi:hypothetical protein
MVRSHVNRRIVYPCSSRAAYKLTMMLSDPATMEECEALELNQSRNLAQDNPNGFTDGQYHLSPKENYARFKLSRSKSLKMFSLSSIQSENSGSRPPQESFSKIIHLDGLDFLYQLCFSLYKCKSESFVTVSNLCGEKMRMIRLWSNWFTESKGQLRSDSSEFCTKLFTRLVWSDPSLNVGFIVSARDHVFIGNTPPITYAGFLNGPPDNLKFYRIEIEQIIIRNNYLLGLLEGFHS